jgi:hypothetical protein
MKGMGYRILNAMEMMPAACVRTVKRSSHPQEKTRPLAGAIKSTAPFHESPHKGAALEISFPARSRHREVLASWQ